jgi:cytochrome P450
MTNAAGPSVQELPVADWVDAQDLGRDPYPIYERLRRESPVAWIPAVRKILISGFSGVLFAEQHPEVFTSQFAQAHMITAMGGRPMIRKDDPDHALERAAINPTLRPKRIKEVWAEVFEKNAQTYLDRLEGVGSGAADLNRDFAAPLAAKNLMDLIGFRDLDTETFTRWSADFIAGAGNVLEKQSIWERCDATREEAHAHLDELLPFLRANADSSLASLMLSAGMSEESVRLNIFLIISGGMNEPQHMITNVALLLAEHPEFRPELSNLDEWSAVFDEAVRYYTPIGMVTRETRAEIHVDGVAIPADSAVGLLLASANRDSTVFGEPDLYRVGRPEQRHLGFGSGTHMCAGKWAAEESVGRIAMPALYTRLPDLRVDDTRPTSWDGWAFRGMTALPVVWN